MAGSYTTTTNFGLHVLLGTSKVSDIDEGFAKLAADIDAKMVGFVADTLAKRPAAGIGNRLFFATDAKSAGGGLYRDTGAAWEPIMSTGAAIQSPTALTARITGTEYEPNANRPTLVRVSFSVGSAGELTASVNGVIVTNFAASQSFVAMDSFIVPAGAKWRWDKSSGTCAAFSSYTYL